ncbi:hypothetical protein ACJX0J_022666, partial [Zea mays]
FLLKNTNKFSEGAGGIATFVCTNIKLCNFVDSWAACHLHPLYFSALFFLHNTLHANHLSVFVVYFQITVIWLMKNIQVEYTLGLLSLIYKENSFLAKKEEKDINGQETE